MPYGFIGNACLKFLSKADDAMASAHAVCSKNPFAGVPSSKTTLPVLPAYNKYVAEHTPDTAKSGGHTTGVGNQSNIVIDQDIYQDTLNKISTIDKKFAEDFYNLSVKIEEMCGAIYIVPDTSPKILASMERLKSSLGTFQELTNKAGTYAHEFVDQIMSIDGG